MKYDFYDDIRAINSNLESIVLKDARVFISGGAGFLGSWICHVLISQGAYVLCLDNLSSGIRKNIRDLENNPRFSFIKQDICEPLQVKEQIDYVMHLASRASPLEFDKFPLEIIRANTVGTSNALELATNHQATFLFTSTSETYGKAELFPTPETYNGNVSTYGIRGCYDESKRAGEAICMAYLREKGTDVRIARIFNTYGPFMRADGVYGRVIPRFIAQALKGDPITIFGDGAQTRSFCYVTDQVSGLLKFLTADSAKGEIVNMGNNEETTILALSKLIIKLTESESDLKFETLPEDDPPRRLPDIAKAKRLIGYAPKVHLEEGLNAMITYMK